MRLRTVRYSGAPVAPENLQAYDEAFKAGYDAIVAEHGQDMLTVHTKVQALEADLLAKFDNVERQQLPTTAKAWRALLDVYGAPVMVARSSENPNELVLVIVDIQLS